MPAEICGGRLATCCSAEACPTQPNAPQRMHCNARLRWIPLVVNAGTLDPKLYMGKCPGLQAVWACNAWVGFMRFIHANRPNAEGVCASS